VQDIIAHPEEQPSLDNIKRLNPSLDIKRIHEELHDLAGNGVVERVDAEGEPRYRLTENGCDELHGTGLFNAQATLKYYYQKA